ncbi:MAG TPA: hypothetical protein RMI29_07085 [Polyangiaceae bacterium LLY-WYZ-15_(1-7)]|nr:hypothetical protein [Polyangiaceae bacterium LLY-WYZ-15_(1-7)]HJL01158.1 hypothetical protein [Polyangiaceae bacterium LLY-WYZ-15_(1-7)]HJL33871.1 hypothetical protein [Polyangiaceae bacterium LLY-WYZ-15_(1-7)]HJL36718.1 hypothetical protein [Polyangiaceae bacterium LLY-WYZ-15_(1-7)]
MYHQLREALIQAYMSRMQGVNHTAASYAADVTLDVLRQHGVVQAGGAGGMAEKQGPPGGAVAGKQYPGAAGMAEKGGPPGGVPADKMGKTPGYGKAGYHGGKAAPPAQKMGGGYDKGGAPGGKMGGAPGGKMGGGYDKGAGGYDKGGYGGKGGGFKK